MKVAFASNFLSHHQKPFCSAMVQDLGKDFCFVSANRMDDERIQLGWQMTDRPEYELCAYESTQKYEQAKDIINSSDVVIIGSASDALIQDRLKKKKLTFKYSERFYKGGTPLRRFFRDAAAAWLHHGRFQRYPLYMLCASAFTAADAGRFGNYIDRCYKWGYFPQTVHYRFDELMRKKENELPIILWAGRFLDWKHPDDAVHVACRLKESGYRFHMEIIGNGAMEDKIRQQIEMCGLSDCVKLLGSMSPGQVRRHMEQANIYLFTSDRNEGWGAVLNESMNSGCAVVASHAIGSAPFLLKHKENGLIYRSCDVDSLYRRIKYLLDNPEEQVRLGRNAYHTIIESWNAEEAARRLDLLFADIQECGRSDRFADGPCSKAPIIKDDWFVDEE